MRSWTWILCMALACSGDKADVDIRTAHVTELYILPGIEELLVPMAEDHPQWPMFKRQGEDAQMSITIDDFSCLCDSVL